MKRTNQERLHINASLRTAGLTFYTKQGQTIVRSATSIQPKQCSPGQFDVRQRMGHNRRLWIALHDTCEPLLTVGTSAQAAFHALAASLPPLYLTREQHRSGITLLVPGTPVSAGTLPSVGLTPGTVDGVPALLTDLSPDALDGDERLTLVDVRQIVSVHTPRLVATRRNVNPVELTVADGCLALTGEVYGDSARGWALVRQRRRLCSTQRLVTAATAYLDYRSPEALERAAASYGGLTPPA